MGLIFQLNIGLSSFWLHSVDPFYWIWEKLLFMLGGLILPLTAYPPLLQKIAFWTPFPAILGDRSALVLQFDFLHVASLLLHLFAWLAIAAALLFFLYRRGLRILNLEGG